MVKLARTIYVNVNTPNLGFTYFNFLGGGQLKKRHELGKGHIHWHLLNKGASDHIQRENWLQLVEIPGDIDKHLLGILKKALSYLRMNGGLVIYSLYRCNLSELLD